MKNLLKILPILLFSFAFTTACNSSSSEEAEEKPEVIADSETKLAIEGMMCVKGCVGLITKELKKMSGVGEFEINFDEAYAEIDYDSKQVSVEEIILMIDGLADHSYSASIFEEKETSDEEMNQDSEEIESEESQEEKTEQVEA